MLTIAFRILHTNFHLFSPVSCCDPCWYPDVPSSVFTSSSLSEAFTFQDAFFQCWSLPAADFFFLYVVKKSHKKL